MRSMEQMVCEAFLAHPQWQSLLFPFLATSPAGAGAGAGGASSMDAAAETHLFGTILSIMTSVLYYHFATSPKHKPAAKPVPTTSKELSMSALCNSTLEQFR